MAKPARKTGKDNGRAARKRGPARVYTAWHPVLVVLLRHVLPHGWFQCLSEFQLAREPLRIDVVIVRRSREGVAPVPTLLKSILGDLAHDTLVHFKGPSDELERDDARMLLAYAYQYLVVAEISDPGDVALRVVASRMAPRFVAELRALGCELTSSEPGVHVGRLGIFPIRVVEAERVNVCPGEHLLYTVTPGMVADPGGIPALSPEEIEVFWALLEHVEQVRHPLPGQRKRHMKDESKVVESFEQALERLVARLSPEQRLAGLAPEQRLAGLAPEQRLAGLAPEQVLRTYAPEQRLAGLTEAQAVLALPDATLRALDDDYLAKLPRETQVAIRKRLAAASPERTARRSKARRPTR